jgi:hypothetical protein
MPDQITDQKTSSPASDSSHSQEGDQVTSPPAGSTTGAVKQDTGNATESSGAKGDNPSTAGPGPTGVHSNTPENAQGHLNPSAPEDSNTTPGTTLTK